MDLTLDTEIMVDGVGRGFVAVLDGDRITIEFFDATEQPITVPRSHVKESSLYEPSAVGGSTE